MYLEKDNKELAYWRKANAIHKWFIDHCAKGNDDCSEMEVSRADLEKLYSNCKEVLASSKLVKAKIKNGKYASPATGGRWVDNIVEGKTIKDQTVAHKLLPTTDGFFFGSTDYDQYYIGGIKYTMKVIKKILKDEQTTKYTYYASW